MMNLICYLIDDRPIDIQPSSNRRKWMNEMPYSYRCLPLSIANAHGWEAHCPLTFEAEWNGGPKAGDIEITFQGERRGSLKAIESHFGGGILTFNLGVIIRTDAGYDLWITGPVNEPKDGIQPLTAIVETSWMPNTFTMNWKFTRPNTKIRFEKGEPFCLFFPVEHRLLEHVNPIFRKLSADPALEKQDKITVAERSLLRIIGRSGRELKERDRQALKWQGWYTRGEMPDGTKVEDHKKRVELKPFKDGS